MQHKLISLKIFPKKIQKILYERSNTDFNLIGNNNVSQYYKIPVVQFQNKERSWLLKHEIRYKNLHNLIR